MILKYNEARALMTEHPEGEPMIRIIPKVNEVEDRQWNLARPHLLHKIAAGLIVELGATVKKDGKAEVYVGKKLAEFSAQEAEALVAETLDASLLEKWKKTELRDAVRLAIANQLEELKKAPEKAAKKDGE